MRINHWVVAVSMLAAIITGLYIGHPYYQTLIAVPAVDKFVMAWNRAFHFYAAIIFDVSSIVVAYLYFFSRFEKAYKKLLPTPKNIVEFFAVLLNLVTLNHVKKFDSSHADSFNAVYFFIFHLMLVFMLFTGLQLYVHGLESGASSIGAWWPSLLHLATDWTLSVFGGNMGVRYIHHYTAWFLVGWVMIHIYYQIWRTVFWREGDIAIAFGGEKYPKSSEAHKA